MTYFTARQNFEHGEPPKIGVLVCNLGTPDAPDASSVRRYLAEFLSDKRVVESPRWIWKPILHGVILRFRPHRSAAAYQKVWGEAGSPLLTISVDQTKAIDEKLNRDHQGRYVTALGMRYGKPSIASALQALREQNVRQIIVLPMYPQYASATTGSVFDAVAKELSAWRWVPELHFLNEYHSDPRYLDALSLSVQQYWAKNGRAEQLLMSFHGIPEEYFLAGDPYFCHCQATARELAKRLELDDDKWTITFQSRVGRKQWLRPYTDHMIESAAQTGVKTLDVVCPGFAADCLETLEEIALQNAEIFHQHGGEHLNYIPALNTDDAHVSFLTSLIEEHTQRWLETPIEHGQLATTHRAETKERADKMKQAQFPK